MPQAGGVNSFDTSHNIAIAHGRNSNAIAGAGVYGVGGFTAIAGTNQSVKHS